MKLTNLVGADDLSLGNHLLKALYPGDFGTTDNIETAFQMMATRHALMEALKTYVVPPPPEPPAPPVNRFPF